MSGHDAAGTFDTVVIGAGVVGSAAALALARRGQRVALVERNAVGDGTTARSFAWLNATSKVGDEAYHRLNAAGLAGYQALARMYGETRIGLNPTGMCLAPGVHRGSRGCLRR